MIELKIGEVLQIKPDFKTKCFAACLAVVVEPRDWGALCYIQGVGKTFEESTGQYYLRIKWEDFETTGGLAPWIIDNREEGAESA